MESTSHLSVDTLLATSARPDRAQGNAVNFPVSLTSTYFTTGAADGIRSYGRFENETWDPAEQLIADLEGAAFPALLHASGMAAIDNAQALNAPGAPIVMPRHSYHAALLIANQRAEREGGEVRTVDITSTEDVIAAMTSPTPAGMVWIESPTNPMLEIADIKVIAAAAHEIGALVVVDNTFATPLGQKPLELGVDVVVHSATKYLNGHSDVVAGATVTSNPELQARLFEHRSHTGAILGPFEAFLLLRGMRTLALRMERINANATELARRLVDHPLVAAVNHPSLPTHPQHELAKSQMAFPGGILTLRPKGGEAAAEALPEHTKLWLPATSLGGVESSLERRRRWADEAPTVPVDLLRLSVGIESVDDLFDDLIQAIAAVQ